MTLIFVQISMLLVIYKYLNNFNLQYVGSNVVIFPHIGGQATVQLELTVPFVCNDKNFQCHLDFEIVITDGKKKVCKDKPPFLGTAQVDCKTRIAGLMPGQPIKKQQTSNPKYMIFVC